MTTNKHDAHHPVDLISTLHMDILDVFIFIAKAEGLSTIRELSEELNLGKSTVEKLMRFIKKNDCVVAKRGVTGGYCLNRRPEDITFYDMLGFSIAKKNKRKSVSMLTGILIESMHENTLAGLIAYGTEPTSGNISE